MPLFELYDLRITVVEIRGKPVCGLAVGDYFEITESSHLLIPPDRHFCIFALASIMPVLVAHQRTLDAGDWMTRDTLIACPDPDEQLIMKIERIGVRVLDSDEIT